MSLSLPAARSAAAAFAAGVILAGCAALGIPDRAVPFAAMAPRSSPEPGASPEPAASPDLVAGPDGWSIALPAGWATTDLSRLDPAALGELLSLADPAFAVPARTGLELSGARLGLVAIDATNATDPWPASLVVLTLRTRGLPRDTARDLVAAIVTDLPLAADPVESAASLAAGDAHRWELAVTGETAVLRIRADLFRVAGDAILVAAIAPDERFATDAPVFDAILESLRFGV